MSSTAAPFPMTSAPDLAALRAELDTVDDALHDLLMRRADVVAQVGRLAVKGKVPLRPGREAAIIARLLARHHGPLPPAGLVRIWREMLFAMTAIQRSMLIAVCDAEPNGPYAAAAREHFGALIPLHVHRTPAQAVREVSAGTASAAVLPPPLEDETPQAAWWTALLHKDEPRIHVVARLPFWAARPQGAPLVQALVVSTAAPDPSGSDRSLLGLELPLDASRARLGSILATAGFKTDSVILRRDPGAAVAHALADVDGFVSDGDPRLPMLGAGLHRPVVLGAYANPIRQP